MISIRTLLMITVLSVSGAVAQAQDAPPVETPALDAPAVDAPVADVPVTDGAVVTPAPDVPVTEVPAVENTTATTPAVPEAAAAADQVVPVPEDAPANALADGTVVTDVASLPEEKVVPLPALSEDSPVEKGMLDQLRIRKPPIDIEKIPSLFLTVWERDLVINARKGLITRDPEAPDLSEPPAGPPPVFEGPRDLRLSGILYRSSNDWVIWLNAKRISPTRLPQEIMNIKVFKDYIELEWFDAATNQIFPVRLRPHQRFNLDARLFLPG